MDLNQRKDGLKSNTQRKPLKRREQGLPGIQILRQSSFEEEEHQHARHPTTYTVDCEPSYFSRTSANVSLL